MLDRNRLRVQRPQESTMSFPSLSGFLSFCPRSKSLLANTRIFQCPADAEDSLSCRLTHLIPWPKYSWLYEHDESFDLDGHVGLTFRYNILTTIYNILFNYSAMRGICFISARRFLGGKRTIDGFGWPAIQVYLNVEHGSDFLFGLLCASDFSRKEQGIR